MVLLDVTMIAYYTMINLQFSQNGGEGNVITIFGATVPPIPADHERSIHLCSTGSNIGNTVHGPRLLIKSNGIFDDK